MTQRFPRLSLSPGERSFIPYKRPFFISLLLSWASWRKSVKYWRPSPRCPAGEQTWDPSEDRHLLWTMYEPFRAWDPWPDVSIMRHVPQKMHIAPFSSPFHSAILHNVHFPRQFPSCLFQELQQSLLAWPTCFFLCPRCSPIIINPVCFKTSLRSNYSRELVLLLSNQQEEIIREGFQSWAGKPAS